MAKILCVLNYYSPYISGLTEYARVMCEEMARRGHSVTVLASNHDRLPETEVLNGVRVLRAPILGKISKGTVSPAFILWARRIARQADIVWLHLPMLEAGVIARLVDRRKLFCMYHCDINLPAGLLNRFITAVMDLSARMALARSRKVFVTSVDYGSHSRVGRHALDKLVEAGAPIKEYAYTPQPRPVGKKVIGFCGRIVEEKGIDVLLNAYARIRRQRNDVVLRIGGDYQAVAGSSVYPALCRQIEAESIPDVTFLGRIPDAGMGDFYAGLDVLALPSVNTLEAFGMVQVEAMLCGTPVVTSDLYGVRTIVQKTGMGLVTRRGDDADLARALLQVLDDPQAYRRPREEILQHFSTEKCYQTIVSAFAEQAEI